MIFGHRNEYTESLTRKKCTRSQSNFWNSIKCESSRRENSLSNCGNRQNIFVWKLNRCTLRIDTIGIKGQHSIRFDWHRIHTRYERDQAHLPGTRQKYLWFSLEIVGEALTFFASYAFTANCDDREWKRIVRSVEVVGIRMHRIPFSARLNRLIYKSSKFTWNDLSRRRCGADIARRLNRRERGEWRLNARRVHGQWHLRGHRRAERLPSTAKIAYKSFIYGNGEWKRG